MKLLIKHSDFLELESSELTEVGGLVFFKTLTFP